MFELEVGMEIARLLSEAEFPIAMALQPGVFSITPLVPGLCGLTIDDASVTIAFLEWLNGVKTFPEVLEVYANLGVELGRPADEIASKVDQFQELCSTAEDLLEAYYDPSNLNNPSIQPGSES